MKIWLVSVLVVALISIVLSCLFPFGKVQKTVSKSIGIALIVIIVSPLVGLFEGGVASCSDSFDFICKEDYDYIEYSNGYLIECLSLDIKKQLSNDGFDNSDVTIDFTTNNDQILINNLTVKVKVDVIENENEHIDKCKKIVSSVKKKLELPEEKIIVIFE
jgi:hypothetical protein